MPNEQRDTPSRETVDAAATGDLDAIEEDLAGVEAALARLEADTYWTDEVTGKPLPPELLDADPLARRLPD